MSMDMHSVMTGKDMRNLRIKSVRGALFFAYSQSVILPTITETTHTTHLLL